VSLETALGAFIAAVWRNRFQAPQSEKKQQS
jgi:hypothetical protein